MAQGQTAIGFNRVASGTLGATFDNCLIVSIPNTVSKELNSIHFSVTEGVSPVNFTDYIVRIMVCDQQPTIQTINDFSPNDVDGTYNYGDVGHVYYDHVVVVPYNNPIIFDEPILFAGSTKIFVVMSIPYADGGSIVTPTAYYCRLSCNGRLLESPSLRYQQR